MHMNALEVCSDATVALADLPAELLRLILLSLPAEDVVAAHQVCKVWQQLCMEPQLWTARLWAALGANTMVDVVCDADRRTWEGEWCMLRPAQTRSHSIVPPTTHTFKVLCHAEQASSRQDECRMLTGRVENERRVLVLDRCSWQLVGHLLEQGGAKRNRKKIDFIDVDSNVAFTWHKVAPDVCNSCRQLKPQVRRDWLDSRICLCLSCWDVHNAAP